ncbi:MAG: hypothetical protein D6707_10710 [Bacteroidetes bacterium]|nr:MAG: hypothetical protein D6707_10710 [Bacteroidota bacterium]
MGRGGDESYCILMTGHKLSNEARIRMETMVQTNNGFTISETDLKLRGPGDITGLQQSGLVNLKIADLSHDQQVLNIARNAAIDMLSKDETLSLPEHEKIKQLLQKRLKNKLLWSRIS